MKTRFWIFIASISLLAVLYKPLETLSCGPMLEAEETKVGLFRPEVSGNDDWDNFQYSPHLPYPYGDETQERDLNCKEWRDYTGKNISLRDIFLLQYETAPDDFTYAYNTGDWAKLADNSFVQWLRIKKNKKALDYFAFAKRVEYLQTQPRDEWQPHGSGFDLAAYDSTAKEAIKRCDTKLPDFLRNRYAFQGVKLFYYSKLYAEGSERSQEAVTYYDTYLKGKKTIVAQWGLLYYALSQPNPIQQTRYLVQTFDALKGKRGYAFQFISNERLDSLLSITTKKNERATIYAVKGINNPGRAIDELKQVISYDANSKYIPLLVTREINKLEDWILSPELLGFNSDLREMTYYKEKYADTERDYSGPDTTYDYYTKKNLLKDKQYLKEIASVLNSLLQNGYKDADFMHLSIAHLNNMTGDYKVAKQHMDAIKNQSDARFSKQLLIERMLYTAQSQDITTATTKQELNDIINAFFKEGNGTHISYYQYEGDIETGDDLSELLEFLSKRYYAKGDVVTAGLLHQKAEITTNEYNSYVADSVGYSPISYFDKYAAPEDVDKVIALKHKQQKTAFEKTILPEVWGTDEMYLDLKTTLLVRQRKYKEALQVAKTISDSFWVNTYEFNSYLPKSSVTSVGTLLPVPSGNNKIYAYTSKKLILAEIVALQEQAAQEKNPVAKAKTLFMLGNALYNISYYGKAWMVYGYGKSSGGISWVYYNVIPNEHNYTQDYYECASAVKAYKDALLLSGNDKELGAKCVMMLAYCDKIGHYNDIAEDNGIRNYSRYDEPAYQSRYLNMLRTKYAKTRTFELGYSTCPDISEYMTK